MTWHMESSTQMYRRNVVHDNLDGPVKLGHWRVSMSWCKLKYTSVPSLVDPNKDVSVMSLCRV